MQAMPQAPVMFIAFKGLRAYIYIYNSGSVPCLLRAFPASSITS